MFNNIVEPTAPLYWGGSFLSALINFNLNLPNRATINHLTTKVMASKLVGFGFKVEYWVGEEN